MEKARDRLDLATNPDPDGQRKMAAEEEAMKLLAGFSRDDRGKPTVRYLERNSVAEKMARAAL